MGEWIQVCAFNRLAKEPRLTERLRQMGFTVETEVCLDECVRCGNCAFGLVAGRLRFAPTVEEFLRARQERIHSPRRGN